MIVDKWDNTILDVVNLAESFLNESNYPITFNTDNTVNYLYGIYLNPESDLIVVYTSDNKLAGAAIVQKVNEFHTEYFGYLSKFYIHPNYRKTKMPFRLMIECVNWFDKHDCIVSFSTATAGIGKDESFIKLANRYGFIQSNTGILTRKKHNG